MCKAEDYKGIESAWCPGCGNFAILRAFHEALVELSIAPHEVMLVSGIGQAAKLPHYSKGHVFNSLHGRALPVATGIRLANHGLPVCVFTGDGDCYGEGGNHFIHTIRRNVNLAHFVHNNQIYGLTKGQASPTTAAGTSSKVQPFGALSEAMNPVALAIALNASFVARGFAGDTEQLRVLMKAAIEHKGYAMVDILQPCVSFNKVNTYAWYKERVYAIEAAHDATDRMKAFERSLEFGDRIPTGVIYRAERPVMEESISVLSGKTLKDRTFSADDVSEIIEKLL